MAFTWFKKVFGPTGQKLQLSTLLDRLERSGGVTGDFYSWVEDGYKKSSAVYGAVNMIALNASTVPFTIFRQDAQGNRTEMSPEHPLVRLLERPNPKFGRSRFFEKMYIYLYIAGKVYVLKASADDGTSKARALHILRPDLVTMRNKDNPEAGWRYRPDPGNAKKDQFFDYEDVLPLYLLDPVDEDDGLSPVQVAALSINQGNFSREWNQGLLQNQARPPGILTNQGEMLVQDDEVEKILNRFQSMYGGYKNAGRPLYLRGKLAFQKTGFSPAELDWLDGQRVADRNTSFTFGVPSVLTGDNESATHRNYEEARKALYQDRIMPLVEWIVDELNNWLVPTFDQEGLKIELNKDNIDALQENKNDQWKRVVEMDALTLNEKREAIGYESLGAPGDVLITSRGVIVHGGQVYLPATALPAGTTRGNTDDAGKRLNDDPEENDLQGQKTCITHTGNANRMGVTARGNALFDEKVTPNSLGGACFFNLPSDRKRHHWKVMETEREPFFRVAKFRVRNRLREEATAFAHVVRNTEVTDVDRLVRAVEAALPDQAAAWFELYEKLYLTVGEHFARRVLAAAPSSSSATDWAQAAAVIASWKEEPDVFDPFAFEIRRYLSKEAGKKIAGIHGTTLKEIRRQLTAGVDAGEGIDVLALRIDRIVDKTYAYRAEVIARTEVVSASNTASDIAARSTGVAHSKEWISTPDERTRRNGYDHWTPDGQIVKLDDPFLVSGEHLMYPGDTSRGATSGNVIQCRCTQSYLAE